jgi:hypothetical protein
VRVARGAPLLDRAWPGWAGLLDPELLELASECDGVLGQLYGHITEATSALAGPEVAADPAAALTWAAGHSFEPGPAPVKLVVLDWHEEFGWRVLEAAWHAELGPRRRRRPPSATPLHQRVRRGSELLGRLAPGWAGEVDRKALDFGDVEACLLGQVFGHYQQGLAGLLHRLGDPAATARAPAWTVDHGLTYGDTTAARVYAATTPGELARAWRHALGRRQPRRPGQAGGGWSLVNAPAEERAVLQWLARLLAEHGVDAEYAERRDTDPSGQPVTYRWIGLNGRGRRYIDTSLHYLGAGERFRGSPVPAPTFVWGRNFEHRVAAEPVQAAAEAIARQALARAAELLRQERGGAR